MPIKKVTCIIPAYNEENRVSNIIKIIKKIKLVNQIIVINDGSTDNTLNVIKTFKGIRVIDHKINMGKTRSILDGLKKSKNEIILMIDSDLKNVNLGNIAELLSPVVENKADMTIVLMGDIPFFRIIGADSASGQRAFKKSFIRLKKLEKMERYGFESFLNEEAITNNWIVKIVDWKNVSSTTKGEKHGVFWAIFHYLSMWKQMIKTTGFKNWIIHPFHLARLSKKIIS